MYRVSLLWSSRGIERTGRRERGDVEVCDGFIEIYDVTKMSVAISAIAVRCQSLDCLDLECLLSFCMRRDPLCRGLLLLHIWGAGWIFVIDLFESVIVGTSCSWLLLVTCCLLLSSAVAFCGRQCLLCQVHDFDFTPCGLLYYRILLFVHPHPGWYPFTFQ